ncbi:MAG: 50S ribosomal subunit-associated GTPase HflX, partial [Crocinitomicaceae bacterium]
MVANKVDLTSGTSNEGIQISAKNGDNIDVLKSKLVDEVKGDFNMAN